MDTATLTKTEVRASRSAVRARPFVLLAAGVAVLAATAAIAVAAPSARPVTAPTTTGAKVSVAGPVAVPVSEPDVPAVASSTPASSAPSTTAPDVFTGLTSPDVGDFCADDLTADGLSRFFSGELGEFRGGDYQRALRLPDDRVLWLFQDVFLGADMHLAHNVGMVQSGRCFTLLAGTSGNRSWLGNEFTDGNHRWVWAAGSHLTADGNIQVVLLEMVEEGERYLSHTTPVAQHIATIDPDTWTVLSTVAAPWSSPDLYGWSVTSDGQWTYLYSWCYRQFGFGMVGHDVCTSDVRLARVPAGADLATATPFYWTGAAWTVDASAAAVVFGAADTGDGISPVEVTYVEGRFVAISKPGDWWGTHVMVFTADSAYGPWTVAADTPVESRCGDGCDTYWANLLPYADADGGYLWALSNNTWSGVDATVYRPSVGSAAI